MDWSDYEVDGQLSIFDLTDDNKQFKPKKSTDWKWSFSDYPKEKNGLKVFSCFACGGGSTMGYKLCGCEVLGCCEIDPKMNEVYIKNHNPKYNFLMDIREFNNTPNDELPEELFDLDILDGSPPCTTFSMAGEREESWGKKKKFREGQAEQTLDDLSFVLIETAKKLKPKVVIMENVEGLRSMLDGKVEAKIISDYKEAGYDINVTVLNSADYGVPQMRPRSIFLLSRKDTKIEWEFPKHETKKVTLEDAISAVNLGNCALFIDTIDTCFVCDVKGYEKRSIDTPRNEIVIRGSQEAFVENIRTNTTMLRRLINNENLIIEDTSVGTISKTKIVLILFIFIILSFISK